jgi:hypothetical protein
MSKENQQDNTQKDYSDEELTKMRDNMTSFYKKEAKHLQPQALYFKLLAEIEESKVRRYSAMAQGAHMFAQAEAAEKEGLAAEAAEKESKGKTSRKPKKD